MTLRATGRSRMGSWALKTVPIPPRPIRSMIRYLPMWSAMAAGRVTPARSAPVFDENHADVVAAALTVGLGDEPAAGPRRVAGVGRGHLEDARVGQHVRQSVRAEP